MYLGIPHTWIGYLVILLTAARFIQLLATQPRNEPAKGKAIGSIASGLLDLQALLGIAAMITGGYPPSWLHPIFGIAGAVLGHVGERQAGITAKAGSLWWGLTLLLIVAGLSRM